MTTVTTQYRMFVPRRRRIGGGGAAIDLTSPNVNLVTGDYTAFAPGPIEVHYPSLSSSALLANFVFWSVRGSADGDFTQADSHLSVHTGSDPVTATAWYSLPGSGGPGNGGREELETDAFLVSQDDFVDPTPIQSVTPADAWDHSDVNEFVFTDREASTVVALDSVVDPLEHFERWYSLEGAATAAGSSLSVPQHDTGIAIATYRVPQSHLPKFPPGEGIGGTIVGGVARDGSGGIVINGIYHPIGPWNPMLAGIAVLQAAQGLQSKARLEIQRAALRAIAEQAQTQIRQLEEMQ